MISGTIDRYQKKRCNTQRMMYRWSSLSSRSWTGLAHFRNYLDYLQRANVSSIPHGNYQLGMDSFHWRSSTNLTAIRRLHVVSVRGACFSLQSHLFGPGGTLRKGNVFLVGSVNSKRRIWPSGAGRRRRKVLRKISHRRGWVVKQRKVWLSQGFIRENEIISECVIWIAICMYCSVRPCP